MFKIGEFSRLAGTSIRMLRHYDKLGLLKPGAINSFTGYRRYSAAQLQQVNKINKLKILGFSLNLIKEILNTTEPRLLKERFASRQAQLEIELADLQAKSRQMDSLCNLFLEEETIMNYNVVLKEIPARQVMSVRKTIPNFNDEGQLWGILDQVRNDLKVTLAEPCLGMTLFHDKEYVEAEVDIEVQVSVAGNYHDQDEVRFFEAPAMQVASVTFHGPFEQMPKVTAAAARWIEDNNYRITGPMLNISHVSPAQDPNPNNWVTESCFQVTAN